MILLDDRQNKFKVDHNFLNKLKSTIEEVLKEEQVEENCQISLVFVDNEEIKNINRDCRGIDKATDVLSFPMLTYPQGKVYKEAYLKHRFDETYFDDKELVLGDIVLSLERAKEQSEEFNHSFIRESCYLVTHSVLHLLGYDHMKDDEKKIMRKREEEILSNLNITRNN
ncbi:MAG: rRNA maturation RNase YbeY [Sarcina sp.]